MDNQRQEKTIPLITFFAFQVFFIAVLVSVVFLNIRDDKISDTDYSRQPAITIEGLSSEFPDASPVYMGLIERELASTVKLNSANFNVNDSRAIIREGTLTTQEFKDIGGIYFSMIVDIPNLQQSYQIYAHYPIDGTTPDIISYDTKYVLCLDDPAEIIYPDFKCRDGYSVNIRDILASRYLKYFNFTRFNIGFSDDDRNQLNIYAFSNDIDEATQESYVSEVKSAISSLGISPDIFNYRILLPRDVKQGSAR